MSAGNYIQTIKRLEKVVSRQESQIARLKNELDEQNRKAFEKINLLEKTIYWLDNRTLLQRLFNRQPKDIPKKGKDAA